MFDPRDDARDRDGREDGRARVYDERDRDDDPREGLMRDLDLPRGEERELVALRDRVYELDGEDTRTLAATYPHRGRFVDALDRQMLVMSWGTLARARMALLVAPAW